MVTAICRWQEGNRFRNSFSNYWLTPGYIYTQLLFNCGATIWETSILRKWPQICHNHEKTFTAWCWHSVWLCYTLKLIQTGCDFSRVIKLTPGSIQIYSDEKCSNFLTNKAQISRSTLIWENNCDPSESLVSNSSWSGWRRSWEGDSLSSVCVITLRSSLCDEVKASNVISSHDECQVPAAPQPWQHICYQISQTSIVNSWQFCKVQNKDGGNIVIFYIFATQQLDYKWLLGLKNWWTFQFPIRSQLRH